MAEQSTSAQLKSIAKKIRGCRHELSLPEEHAGYIVELVKRALAVPDAFPGLDCLRREIGRLKYNYPNDWHLRALQAIARAVAPGFKPSSNFMEGGWFVGGWDAVEKIAVATERAAERMESAANSVAISENSLPDGPVPPNSFRWRRTEYRPIAKGPFLALEAAWPNEGHCLHKDDLAGALGDMAETLGEFAMAGIRGELNKFFSEKGIPLHAVVKGLRLAIQDGAPRAAARNLQPRNEAKKRRQSR